MEFQASGSMTDANSRPKSEGSIRQLLTSVDKALTDPAAAGWSL